MTWFEPYNQSDNIVDIYTYTETAQVYPQWVVPYPNGLNPQNYTLNQTVIIDGVDINYSVDFSGVTNTPRYLGTNGGMYCDNNQCKVGCLAWPHCLAFFHYASVGPQLLNNGCDCITDNNIVNAIPGATDDGGIRYPSRLIDPMDPSKAKYWNNPNLWYNVFSNGYVLIKNDGPEPGEPDSEEYLITVGHPIGIGPCGSASENGERDFSFFDSTTNALINRRFVCPCVAWSLPHAVTTNGEWNGDQCGNGTQDQLNLGFSSDTYRLWVMKADEPAIPDSITRHKVLLGSFPNNQMSGTKGWPVYDVDPQMRVSKHLTYKKTNGQFGFVPDRTEDVGTFYYAGIANFYVSTFSGQGDDGHPSFTITQDQNPETIFIGWNQLSTKTRSKNIPTICGPVNSLEAAENYYNIDDNRNIVITQECDPGVFNPTLIDGYIEGEFSTDPAEVINGKYSGNAARDVLYNLTQPLLTLYGKPNIVFYQFPGEMYIPDIPFLGNITESNTKYPLRNSPYLSRESINNIFENSNIVAFNEQKMLQAAELNELQEKFYKNQSLSIQFYNNWFTKNNLTQNATDILGTSGINFKLNPTLRSSLANTTTPLNPSSITIFKSPENIYTITINKDYYRLVSNFAGIKFDAVNGTAPNGKINHNVDYVNILIDQITTIDLNDMTEEEICFINVRIDYGNLITCNEYAELKDNSGDTSNAPCGASRNFLRLAAADPIISTLILKNNLGIGGDTTSKNLSPINNLASEIYPATYLLTYAKKENGVITFYHSNGIKIQ
jgi:hypothetical protein